LSAIGLIRSLLVYKAFSKKEMENTPTKHPDYLSISVDSSLTPGLFPKQPL
jgi:hypothetical protein